MVKEKANLPAVQSSAPKGIPIEDLIEYRAKGLTHEEIATLVGCSPANVTQRLQAADLQSLDNFETHKAKTFEHLQRRAVQNITDEDLKSTSAAQRVWIAGVLQDKIAAIRGQATEIIEHRTLSLDLSKAYEAMRQSSVVSDTDTTQDAQVIDIPVCPKSD